MRGGGPGGPALPPLLLSLETPPLPEPSWPPAAAAGHCPCCQSRQRAMERAASRCSQNILRSGGGGGYKWLLPAPTLQYSTTPSMSLELEAGGQGDLGNGASGLPHHAIITPSSRCGRGAHAANGPMARTVAHSLDLGAYSKQFETQLRALEHVVYSLRASLYPGVKWG